MRFLFAGPESGVRQVTLNELMQAIGSDGAIEASRLAETDPVVQVASDPIRLVRLMAPGDESLTFDDLLEMLPEGSSPPRPVSEPARYPVTPVERPDQEDGDYFGLDDPDMTLAGSDLDVLAASGPAGTMLAERIMSGQAMTIAETIDWMVEAHKSEEFAYREVEGEVLIKVPMKLLVGAARSDAEAREIVERFSAGLPLEAPATRPRGGILWDPVAVLQDALDAINTTNSPADADWELRVEKVSKLGNTAMRALARTVVNDIVKRMQIARREARAERDASLARTIASLTAQK